MSKKNYVYLVVEAKPKNKAEFRQLGDDVRAESIRTSMDGTKFILRYDGSKKARPDFIDRAKTKTYTHDQMLKEITKKNSEWQDNPDPETRAELLIRLGIT